MNQTNIQHLIEFFLVAMIAAITSPKIHKQLSKLKQFFKPHKVEVKYQIRKLTDELQIKLSDRLNCVVCVNVWNFENSTYSISGYGFEYFRLICHSSSKGFFNIVTYERIRVEPYIDFLKHLNDADGYYFTYVDDAKTSTEMKALFNELGLKMALDIKFSKDVFKGFLSVGLPEFKNLTEHDMELIKQYTASINQRIKQLAK